MRRGAPAARFVYIDFRGTICYNKSSMRSALLTALLLVGIWSSKAVRRIIRP